MKSDEISKHERKLCRLGLKLTNKKRRFRHLHGPKFLTVKSGDDVSTLEILDFSPTIEALQI